MPSINVAIQPSAVNKCVYVTIRVSRVAQLSPWFARKRERHITSRILGKGHDHAGKLARNLMKGEKKEVE